MNALIVCSSNISRSQMAMEYFKLMTNGMARSTGTRVTKENQEIGDRENAQNVIAAMQ